MTSQNVSKSTIRQFAVVAPDGRIVCIEQKATPKSAKRIAAKCGADYRVMHIATDGSEHNDVDVAGDGWRGWAPASAVRRVDDGISTGLDRPRRRRPANDKHRLHALGNAVVPQVAEVIGRVLNELLEVKP